MASSDNSAPEVAVADSNVLRLISWNIDGLDAQDSDVRIMAVCDTIVRLAPDVVFLQEVVVATQLVLMARLSSKYEIIPAGQTYYVCTLVKKSPDSKVTAHEIVPFPGTKMMRNLLEVKACYKGVYLSLMNTHLESTGPETKERVSQFQQVLAMMQMAESDRVAICGGDTNLREKEVGSIGGVPEGILDLWEACGSDPKTRFTWDTELNINLDWDHGKSRPRLRFDRLFLRSAAGHAANLCIRSFKLIGQEMLPSCSRFPSDHWGIVCDFDVLPADL